MKIINMALMIICTCAICYWVIVSTAQHNSEPIGLREEVIRSIGQVVAENHTDYMRIANGHFTYTTYDSLRACAMANFMLAIYHSQYVCDSIIIYYEQ